jgi:SpoVK/Ycf46/Vps4 family AAA+-type ATPase
MRSGIIEVVDTDVKFEDVGGLKNLCEDLKVKSKIYSNLGDAIKYNIPIPKGILIVGMPGCGKSMIAKATANKFGVSLLRLDVSRLMGKYVGESEANLRLALSTAEAAHPCVLWIDEIEKAFAGGNNPGGDEDMLVLRMMGHFLTWMQERKSPIYIVATANGVLRPEFMRKGRFDEVYFVDFPNELEAAEILKKKIEKKYPLDEKDCLFDFSEIGDCLEIAKQMEGKFAGSEIECVLNLVVEQKFPHYLKEKEANKDNVER